MFNYSKFACVTNCSVQKIYSNRRLPSEKCERVYCSGHLVWRVADAVYSLSQIADKPDLTPKRSPSLSKLSIASVICVVNYVRLEAPPPARAHLISPLP